MKHRLQRVNEILRRELSAIVAREITFRDALVTIQDVDVSTDLRHAHVAVSAIGDRFAKEEALDQLQTRRAELQHLLSRRVILKYTPLLHFRFDESIERGVRIMNLIDHLGGAPPAEPAPPDPEAPPPPRPRGRHPRRHPPSRPPE